MDFQLTLNNKRLKQESSIKYLRIFMLQKKAVRLIAFSLFDAHSSPLFKKLSILKMNDLVEYYVAIFMFKYNNNLLPPVFKNFLFQLAIYTNIKLDLQLKKISIFQNPKPSMENLILDFKARKLGMLLKKSLEKLKVLRSLNII